MNDKIPYNELQQSSLSFVDPVGRVFFARNRVFRIINDNVRDEIQEFLRSECYNQLLQRGWIVNTWITSDVQTEDNKLVLEHEKVQCVKWQLLTYSELWDYAYLHLQIHQLCLQYGYYLFDSSFSNIGKTPNGICLIDFGSIRKGRDDEQTGRAFAPLFYILSMMSERNVTFARSLEISQYTFTDVYPSELIDSTYAYAKRISPMVKKYIVFGDIWGIKFHIPLHSLFGLRGVYFFNRIINYLRTLKGRTKNVGWQKSYPSNKFSLKKYYKLDLSIMNSLTLSNIYPWISPKVNKCLLRESLNKILNTNRQSMNINTVALYGNYRIEDIAYISSLSLGCKIYIISPELPYTEYVYSVMRSLACPTSVILWSPFANHNVSAIKDLNIDLLGVEPCNFHLANLYTIEDFKTSCFVSLSRYVLSYFEPTKEGILFKTPIMLTCEI